ncbi:hypothetical protein BDV96DRAFT_587883 [Lophiotrema nucula]|uniref:F-box domain-containing protein n=1 Tax=Lophiotrema nucula TaxID=690887 RepID=A0A6A5YM39_9PLEO|nr:hypothetical protein BDV96DRAFT_587883 [Lophiotrema nucula]
MTMSYEAELTRPMRTFTQYNLNFPASGYESGVKMKQEVARGQDSTPAGKMTIKKTPRGFLDLPGELRNKIYKLALGNDRHRIPFPGPDRVIQDPAFKLFFLNRRIYLEASSVFVRTATAYIPVMPGMDIEQIVGGVQDGGAGVGPQWGYETIGHALCMMNKTHLHLHMPQLPCSNGVTLLPALMAAIRVLMRHSSLPLHLQQSDPFEYKHNVTIHLDRLFLDEWSSVLDVQDQVTLHRVIAAMAKGTGVEWILLYY